MTQNNIKHSVLLILSVCCIGVGGTCAYQTAFDAKVNSVCVGNNKTSIEEEFPSPSPIPLNEDSEYLKKVWVTNSSIEENSGSVPCYVRVALDYSSSDIGKAVILQNMDTENWIFDSDGYYYYKKILLPGERSTALFDGFFIDASKLEKPYLQQMESFEIQVYEESIQSDGFRDYREAWRSFGEFI